MKTTFLSFFVILNFGLAISQNYNLIQTNDTLLAQSDDLIFALNIDSISFESGYEIQYLTKNIRHKGENCFEILGGSAAGSHWLKYNDGTYILFNSVDDTLRLLSQAHLSDSWIFYQNLQYKIIASVSSVALSTVFGNPDSVKTITFQAYDLSNNPITHDANNWHVSLSKQYGLQDWINFYAFPDFNDNDLNLIAVNSEEIHTIGSHLAHSSIRNIETFDVYNFNIGDEFHVVENSFILGYSDEEHIEQIDKIIGKQVYAGSLVYSIDRAKVRDYYDGGQIVTEISHDTISITYTQNTRLNRLPLQTILEEENYITANWMGSENGRIVKYLDDFYGFEAGTPCDFQILADGYCISSHAYIDRLGGPYWDCDMSNYRKLQYYNANGQTFGTPLVLSINEASRLENNFEISPNPAKDYIVVKTASVKTIHELSLQNTAVEIYDLTGKLVKQTSLRGTKQSIQVEDLEQGIYLVKVGEYTQKLIVE